jgi:zinc D-Ala-D-Ala carboxypeptidase
MNCFKPKEFKCKCGKCDYGVDDMDIGLISKLNLARRSSGVPFIITSAIRCPKHNYDVHGKERSSHLIGKAVDIKCDTSRNRFIILKALYKYFDRIGIAKDFIHVDVDMKKTPYVLWRY